MGKKRRVRERQTSIERERLTTFVNGQRELTCHQTVFLSTSQAEMSVNDLVSDRFWIFVIFTIRIIVETDCDSFGGFGRGSCRISEVFAGARGKVEGLSG